MIVNARRKGNLAICPGRVPSGGRGHVFNLFNAFNVGSPLSTLL